MSDTVQRRTTTPPNLQTPPARHRPNITDDDPHFFLAFILSILCAFGAIAALLIYTGNESSVLNPFGFDDGRRVKDITFQVTVPLEAVYKGEPIKVSFPGGRQRVCNVCSGSGGIGSDGVATCPRCQGSGAVVQRMQIAPGFVQQVQQQCSYCGGSGRIIKHRCHKCNGEGVYRSEEEVQIPIEKGIPEGHVVRLQGGGHEMVGITTGDVVVHLSSQSHSQFRREGDDLHYGMTLTLKESLLGFRREFSHLDGHTVKIERKEVTSPEWVMRIENEGMPKYQAWSQRGSLLIHFTVVFPTKLSVAQREEVQRLLATPKT